MKNYIPNLWAALLLVVLVTLPPLAGCDDPAAAPPPTSQPASQPTTEQADLDDDTDLPIPPSPADIAANKAGLDKLAQMRTKGITPADVPALIDLLSPVIVEPADGSNAPRLTEGYAQVQAEKELLALAQPAHAQLLATLKTSPEPTRSAVFAILIKQGVKQAIDEALAMPDAGGLGGQIGYYLGWFDPDESNINPADTNTKAAANLQALRDWYKKNRTHLTYNPQSNRFELPTASAPAEKP